MAVFVHSDNRDGKFSLQVRGHADFDVAGKDIVCASVSILLYTLAESIPAEDTEGGASVNLLPGNSSVTVTPKAGCEDKIGAVFRVICNGFRLLAENYPENVKFIRAVG